MKKRDWILPVTVFLMLSVILSGLFLMAEKKSKIENQERHRYIAASQANIMKDSVDTAIARVYTFSALIRDNQGSTEFFGKEGAKIYQEIVVDSGIPLKNVAVAPNGVVERVYPVAGNEQLIGFNFMDTSKAGNEEAINAYRQGRVIVTNPFELVQGGVGMAGRLPVFVEKDGKEEFWGLVTVTMDFDQMIQGFRLDSLLDQGVEYQLWYQGADGEKVVLTQSEVAPVQPVTYSFAIENLKWNLDVEPQQGWNNNMELIIIFLALIGISLLISMLLLDKSRIRHVNVKLEQLAHLDGLTNCFSRQYVNTVLVNQRTGKWNDPGARYSLAIVDIDSFKSINDHYGHMIGDRAIVAVAQVLMDNSRQINGDCVIRHGGDEFIVLWNDISEERFLEKLACIVSEVGQIHSLDCPDIRLTVSVGGEPYSEERSSIYYDMTARADKKLYEAKAAGRNRFVV